MNAVFITNKPSPYQVRFCEALQKEMNMTFLFCMDLNSENHSYWKMNLPNECKMLDKSKCVLIQKGRFYRYMNFDVCTELKKAKPDIVMIGDFSHPTCYVEYRWCIANRVKVVFFREFARKEKAIKMYSKLYSKADALLVVGNRAVNQYKKYFSRTPIYNFSYAADIEKKLAYERKANYDENIKFLYASRYVEEHRPFLVLDAFAKLAQKYDCVELVMSSRGVLQKKCEEYAQKLSCSKRITFKNQLSSWDEVNNLFIENDVLVFPGFTTWGLVIPEAMAAKMAVIVCNEVGASELLPSNSWVNPTIDDLFNKMEQYVLNRSLLEEEGSRNRELSKSEQFLSKSKQLNEIFSEVLSC